MEGKGRLVFSAAALSAPAIAESVPSPPQLQIKHAVSEAEIQQLNRKVRVAGSGAG